MIDVVFPYGNEQEFIRIAERLGLEGLCFVYDRPKDISSFQASTSLKLFSVPLCSEKNILRFRGRFTVMKAPDDQRLIRTFLEQHKPSLLFGLESASRSDFIHHRASGINQVHAALMRKNAIIVGFDFSSLLLASSYRRAVIMGRISQNIRFARKFGFQTVIASFASDPFLLRSHQDLKSFFVSLGMHPSEASSSLNVLFKRLESHIN